MLGLLFILIFGIYLLIRKLRAPLRHYVPFEDYFILALALFFSFTGVLVFLESELEDYIALTREMLTPLSFPELSFSETLHTIAFSLLLLILPFTRITHYIAVVFTHLVLWDIRPANHIEAKLSEILKNCRVKWNAEHLNPEMSWKELLKQEMKG
ncbi:MAG: hypothetical protein N3D09_00500 [Archaeoglobaceae archaeon]|nr:hypothetical protein [Archaeoglobaceae archaeon]